MTNKVQNEPLLLDTTCTYTVRCIRLNTYLTLLHQYNYICTTKEEIACEFV